MLRFLSTFLNVNWKKCNHTMTHHMSWQMTMTRKVKMIMCAHMRSEPALTLLCIQGVDWSTHSCVVPCQ